MVYSNKTIQTKRRIQEALLDLLQDSYFHNISVQEIADRAGIDRSTFYRHYLDKFEIVEQLETDILNGLRQYHKEMLEQQKDGTSHVSNLFTYLSPWMETLAILLGPKGLVECRENFRQTLHTCFQNELKSEQASLSRDMEELLLQYKVSSFMGMFFYWIHHPDFESDTIQTYFEQLSQDGIIGLLEGQ